MNDLLRFFLPMYFIVYFGISFVAKSIIVARKIVLPKDNSVYGLIGLYFKLTIILVFIYVFLFDFFPTCYHNFPWLYNLKVCILSMLLLDF